MRGYGSWSIGWNEGRKPSPPSNDNNNTGCLFLVIGFSILLLFSSLKTTFETGNLFALFIGLAVIAGLFKGLIK